MWVLLWVCFLLLRAAPLSDMSQEAIGKNRHNSVSHWKGRYYLTCVDYILYFFKLEQRNIVGHRGNKLIKSMVHI